MSIIYCEKHDRRWDSDKLEECPLCENEHPSSSDAQEKLYTQDDLAAACELVRVAPRMALQLRLKEMVDRFLAWPLPYSVCADGCATRQQAGRIGTNLLTADEAMTMLKHVLEPALKSEWLTPRTQQADFALSAIPPTGQREVAEKCAEICENSPLFNTSERQRILLDCADRIRAYAATLPQQPAVAEGMARDAERYRWLCDAAGKDWNELLGSQLTGQLDAAIDAARLAAAPKQEGKEK